MSNVDDAQCDNEDFTFDDEDDNVEPIVVPTTVVTTTASRKRPSTPIEDVETIGSYIPLVKRRTTLANVPNEEDDTLDKSQSSCSTPMEFNEDDENDSKNESEDEESDVSGIEEVNPGDESSVSSESEESDADTLDSDAHQSDDEEGEEDEEDGEDDDDDDDEGGNGIIQSDDEEGGSQSGGSETSDLPNMVNYEDSFGQRHITTEDNFNEMIDDLGYFHDGFVVGEDDASQSVSDVDESTEVELLLKSSESMRPKEVRKAGKYGLRSRRSTTLSKREVAKMALDKIIEDKRIASEKKAKRASENLLMLQAGIRPLLFPNPHNTGSISSDEWLQSMMESRAANAIVDLTIQKQNMPVVAHEDIDEVMIFDD